MVSYGELLIHTYLPASLIPADLLNAVTMTGFFSLVAKAKECRKLRQEDIQIAVVNAFSSEE